jgi:hypothetical protein
MIDFMDKESNVGLVFSDPVIKKCGGLIGKISEHMKITEPYAPEWTLASDVAVIGDNIDCQPWSVHFIHDGHVVLWESPVRKLSGPDSACIRAISVALMSAGWKRPEPSLHEIDANILFWKQLWETGIVDSRQFTMIYGKRRIFGE